MNEISMMQDQALIKLAEEMKQQTSYTEQTEILQIAFEATIKPLLEMTEEDISSLDELLRSIMEEQQVYGYTLFLNFKKEVPEILDDLKDYEYLSTLRMLSTEVLQELMAESDLDWFTDHSLQVGSDLPIKDHTCSKHYESMVRAFTIQGFYLAMIHTLQENNQSLKSVEKRGVIGGDVDNPFYDFTALHYLQTVKLSSDLEYYEIYRWNGLDVNGAIKQVGELMFFADLNQINIYLNKDVPEVESNIFINLTHQLLKNNDSDISIFVQKTIGDALEIS